MTIESRFGWSSVLGLFSSLAAVLSAAAVALSIIHEYAFFKIIEFNFVNILGSGDYVKSAVSWLPAAALSAVLGYLPGRFSYQDSIRLAEQSAREASVIKQIFLLMPKYSLNFQAIAFTVFCILATIFGPPHMVLLGAFPISTAALIFISRYFGQKAPKEIWIVPFAICYAFFTGLSDGRVAMTRWSPVNTIKTSSPETQKLNPIRFVDKGLLARDPVALKLIFLPWDDVKSVEQKLSPLDERSLWKRFVETVNPAPTIDP